MKRKDTCQDCKKHSNKPSYCKELKQYINRKHEVCALFRRK